jgi:hypothetical protein
MARNSPIVEAVECKSEFKTLRSRLDTYGLAHKEKQLVDITLEANQEWAPSIQDPEIQEHIVHLRPQSPYDLKKWVGIPDHAVRSWPPPLRTETHSGTQVTSGTSSVFIQQLQIVPSDLEMQTNLSSFLLRRSDTITERELGELDKFIDRSAIGVSVFLAQDIYVAAGAQLIFDKKIQVLFARYITIAATGRIQFQSPFAKIDCAGLKRQSPFAKTSTTALTHGTAISP